MLETYVSLRTLSLAIFFHKGHKLEQSTILMLKYSQLICLVFSLCHLSSVIDSCFSSLV